MKKFLFLFSFLLAFLLAQAADQSVTVTKSSHFSSASTSGYNTVSASDATSGFDFVCRAFFGNSSGFQMNKESNNCVFMISGNSNNYTISKVDIVFTATVSGATISVYKSSEAYTEGSNAAGTKSNITGTTLVEEITPNGETNTININDKFFAFTHTGSNTVISSITIYYSTAPAGPTIEMSYGTNPDVQIEVGATVPTLPTLSVTTSDGGTASEISYTATTADGVNAVATVATDGTVTVDNTKVGATTITATYTGTAYTGTTSASYTITIVEAGGGGESGGGETGTTSTATYVFSDMFSSDTAMSTTSSYDAANGVVHLSINNNNGTAAKYYTSGSALRIYQKNSLTISVDDAYYITSIEFVTDSSNPIRAADSCSPGSWNITNTQTTWTASDQSTSSMTVTKGSSAAQTRITSITVYYAAKDTRPTLSMKWMNGTTDCTESGFSVEMAATGFAVPTLSVTASNSGDTSALTYTYSATGVASLDTNNSIVVNTTTPGTGTVTAKYDGSDAAAPYQSAESTLNITVTKWDVTIKWVDASGNVVTQITDKVNNSTILPTAKVYHNDAVVEGVTPTLSSTNTAVVGDDNILVANGIGEATVTASIAEGNELYNPASSSYTITISKWSLTLAYSQETLSVIADEVASATLPTLTITKEAGCTLADPTITYSSSLETIATVDADGKVTLTGTQGTTTITASVSGDNNFADATATYTVSVTSDLGKYGDFYIITDLTQLNDQGEYIFVHLPSATEAGTGVVADSYVGVMSFQAQASNNTNRASHKAAINADGSITFDDYMQVLKFVPDATYTPDADDYYDATLDSKTGYFITLNAPLQDDLTGKTLSTTYNIAGAYLATSASTGSTTKNNKLVTTTTLTDLAKLVVQMYGNNEVYLNFGNDANGRILYNYVDDNISKDIFSCYEKTRLPSDALDGGSDEVYSLRTLYIFGRKTGGQFLSTAKGTLTPGAVTYNNTDYNYANLSVSFGTISGTQAAEYQLRVDPTGASTDVTTFITIATTATIDADGKGTFNVEYLPDYGKTAKYYVCAMLKDESEQLYVRQRRLVTGITYPFDLTASTSEDKWSVLYNSNTEGGFDLNAATTLNITSDLKYNLEITPVTQAEASWEWVEGAAGSAYVYLAKVATTTAGSDGEPDMTNVNVTVTFNSTVTFPYVSDLAIPAVASEPATTAPRKALALSETTARTGEIRSATQGVHSFTITSTTAVTGVEDILTDSEPIVEYYNLQGVRVFGDLAPGIYIRRLGTKVNKVLIK